MKKNKIILLAFMTALPAGAATQNIQIEYITEWQTNMKKRMNWVNLLTVSVGIPTSQLHLWENGEFNFSSKSIFKTSEDRIADDRQTFSNIEETNRLFNLAILGYTHRWRGIALFAGIRNVNEDYFTSPYTSLFTNSSCGIYPTISAHYPLANYPLSGLCLHAAFRWGQGWSAQSSLYNGVAYEPFGAESSIFTFRPKRDGVFNMTEINYTLNSKYNGNYTGGIAVHSSMPDNDESGGEEQAPPQTKEVNASGWIGLEQAVYRQAEKEVGVLAQYSAALTDKATCNHYLGTGIMLKGFVLRGRQEELGLFVNRATFGNGTETVAEITWKVALNKHFTLQPAFHFIKQGEATYTIGMVRVTYAIN